MTTEFCVSNELLAYVLRKVECDPEYVFSETELVGICPKTYKSLKDQKLIAWQRFDLNDPFFSNIPGDQDNPRYLKAKTNGKYDAYPSNDPELECIEVCEADLPHWVFDIDKVCDHIRKSNNLSGKLQKWNGRLVYLGGYAFPDRTAGIAIALYDCDDDAENILSVKWEDYGHNRMVVLCPAFTFKDPLKIDRFSSRNIKLLPFKDAFVNNGFGLNIKLDGESKKVYRNQKEKQDYEKYKYNSLDDFEYLDKKSGHSAYEIKVNGKKASIPNAVYVLLLFFTIKLKKNKKGFVSKDSVSKEGITDEFRDNHIDDLVYELRNKIAPLLKTTDRDGIIEVNNGQYRFSIHPNRINMPKGGWLNDTYSKVLDALKKKRDRRSKQSGRQEYKKAVRSR